MKNKKCSCLKEIVNRNAKIIRYRTVCVIGCPLHDPDLQKEYGLSKWIRKDEKQNNRIKF